MANVTVISNKNSIRIDFGVYATAFGDLSPKSPYIISKGVFEEAGMSVDKKGVTFITRGRNNHTMHFSHELTPPINNKTPYMIIDSINGVKPEGVVDLIDLIFSVFD